MGAPRLKPHNPQELERLLEWVSGATSILEIGSRYGYTLVDIAHRMAPGAKVLSVDLPDQEGWNDPQAIFHLRENIQRLQNEGYAARLIEGDSHDLSVIEAVLAHGPFDVVFIDGDHTYEGVTQDWDYYGEAGNVVIFHDIRRPQSGEWQGLGVWRLWAELKEAGLHCEEFIASGSKMGIGKIDRQARAD